MRGFRFLLAPVFVFVCAPVFGASSTTPNLGLIKPAAAAGTWGADLNRNFDIIDNIANLTAPTAADVIHDPSYCPDAGVSDTYVCSPRVTLDAYTVGTSLNFQPNTNNTGAATVNVNSLGAKAIKYASGSTLANDALVAGQFYRIVYDGTDFRISSSGSGAVGADLTAIEALSSTGFSVRTGSDIWAQRTHTAGTGMSCANGDGVAGNPTCGMLNPHVHASAGSAPSAGAADAGKLYVDTRSADYCNSIGLTYVGQASSGNYHAIASESSAYVSRGNGIISKTACGSDTDRIGVSNGLRVYVFAGTTNGFANQPTNDGVEIVSSNAGDTTQTVTIYGTISGGTEDELFSETKTLNGTSVVSFTRTNWQNVLAVVISAAHTGTVTVRKATGDATIIAIASGTLRAAHQPIEIIEVRNHVKSIYFPAGALSTDGTQCAAPSEVIINSGAKRWTILCADNDASTIYGEADMPDSWDGGTVTLMGAFIQTAADTSNMNSDVAMACRATGDTINNTWGTEIAMDVAMGGSNKVTKVTTSAITPNGTCTGGGKTLQFRWQLDATGTTTAVATMHVVDFKLEYTVAGSGSD